MPLNRVLVLLLLLIGSLPAPATAAEAHARELINALGCKGCHSLGENGGNLGPDLNGIGSRLSREAIRSQLVDPKGKNPDSLMPSYDHLPEGDLEALTDYLASRR